MLLSLVAIILNIRVFNHTHRAQGTLIAPDLDPLKNDFFRLPRADELHDEKFGWQIKDGNF